MARLTNNSAKVLTSLKGLDQRTSEEMVADTDFFNLNGVYPVKVGSPGKFPGKTFFQKLVSEPILNIVQTFDSRNNIIIQTLNTIQMMTLDDFYLNPYIPNLNPVPPIEEEQMYQALIVNKQSVNTSGQTVGTSVVTCNITDIVENQTGYLALASNQITLPAGNYRVKIQQAVNGAARFKGYLWNITTNNFALPGPFQVSTSQSSTSFVNEWIFIEGFLALTVTTVLEVRAISSSSSNGLGAPTNFSSYDEIYLVGEFLKYP